MYPEVSDYVDGARPPREVLAHMVDFIEIEDRLHDERNITPAMELKSLEYEIRDVCKYRSRCCLLLADPGLVGESRDPPVWVPLEELSRTAKNILANFKPEQFEHARKDERLDLADIGPGGKVTELGKMIHVDSPEPVELLVSLTVAPVEPKPPVPQPATLALCGEGAEKLAELLAETYPDIYAVAERQEPEPEKPRTEDADADDAGDDADDANEEQNPTDDGDANEEQNPEDEDENADAAAETASEWTAEAYPGALHAARLRREGLCAVVVLDATETPTFKAAAETADAAPMVRRTAKTRTRTRTVRPGRRRRSPRTGRNRRCGRLRRWCASGCLRSSLVPRAMRTRMRRRRRRRGAVHLSRRRF